MKELMFNIIELVVMCDFIEKEGYRYKFDQNKCKQCQGSCCCGKSGYIWVTDEEIKSICKLLKMDLKDFKNNYLRKINNRLSIKELKISGNYYCVFFDIEKKCCSIYNERPMQCREFPFWDYYKNRLEDLMKECPGVILKESCYINEII